MNSFQRQHMSPPQPVNEHQHQPGGGKGACLSSLPSECMAAILRYLQTNHHSTLAALLCVNRAMFDQAVVFLYNNPFAAAGPALRWRRHEQTVRRHAALLSTFLLEADPDIVKTLPFWSLKHKKRKMAHGAFGHQAQVARMKRAMLLGTLGSEDGDHDDGDDMEEESEDEDEDEKEYLIDRFREGDNTYDPEAQAKTTQRQRRFYLHYFRHYRYQNASMVPIEALRRVFPFIAAEDIPHVQRCLVRAFMVHNPNNILSLSLNAPDMAFMDIKGVIPSLSSLRFLQIDRLTALQESEMDCVLDWVTRHNELHGTIKHLTLGGNHDAAKYADGDRSYLVKVAQAFPSLLTLVMSQWADAWRNIGAIPALATLRRLVMDHGDGHPRPEDADFLAHCERLEILDLYVAELDPFHQLAKRYLAHHYHHRVSDLTEKAVKATPSAPIRGIPPIHKLYISGEGAHPHLRNAFDSAPVALSQTLRILKVSSMDRFTVDRPSLTWGGGPSIGLQLPFLQELQLQGDIGLEFPFRLLECCPNLVSLRIVVNGLESCARAGNDLGPILLLKKLQVLQLIGRWPVSIPWLEGLAAHVTGLKMLDLQGCADIKLLDVLECVGRMPLLRRLGWDADSLRQQVPLIVEWAARNPSLVVDTIPLQAYYM